MRICRVSIPFEKCKKELGKLLVNENRERGGMTDRIEDTPAQVTWFLTAGIVFAVRQEAKRRGIKSISEFARELLKDGLEISRSKPDGTAND